MTETISIGPEAFLESLIEELSLCAPAHHVSFAAILAERQLALAGENADWTPRLGQGAGPREIMVAVWGHACGRAIAPERLDEFEAGLSEVMILVDPDRVSASAAYRAIWLVRLTMRVCAPGAGADAAVKVARSSLHISAMCDNSYDYIRDWSLREKWNNPGVQAEARLLNKLAHTLRATSHIGHDTVEALQRDFVT